MQISKGFGTWAGVVGALGTFVLAIATFMDTFNQLDPLAGLGPLLVAGGVFYKVLDGRFNQAVAVIQSAPATAGDYTEPTYDAIPEGSVPAEGGQ